MKEVPYKVTWKVI